MDATQEIRFAVVMYGGVSLAIYINGVAQELLRMVRSTAPQRWNGDSARPLGPADGTEHVYRKLSHILADRSLRAAYRETLAGPEPPPEGDDPVDRRVRDGAPIRTRFVVDILSGTSAGGINAIYLAKALANDQPIDQLKDLWISEGDLALLINDRRSLAGLALDPEEPPQSLLNSRRMYIKLLEALDGMEEGQRGGSPPQSPHVDELDLFITATDLEGVPLPLQLSDAVVYERRHRNVFHFKYDVNLPDPDPESGRAGVRNDFEARYNPFLAFAARCTSSFPFAFDPMRLCDIDPILDRLPRYRADRHCRSGSRRWQRFFREPLSPRTGMPGISFPRRAFGDGGYLDNKPFSYATETLLRRQSSIPVDRKLIYVEPSPEHPEDDPVRERKPDAIANIKAALLDLPRYETIREDLLDLLQRNRLIERVNRISDLIEQDIEAHRLRAGTRREARAKPEHDAWNQMDLAEMVDEYSVYYLPYRRLRIASVTDAIASLIARLTNIDEESDLATALRFLVRAWRERAYADYTPAGETRQSVNQFLHDYDFSYRVRRLHSVRNRIDQLFRLVRERVGDSDGVAGAPPSSGEARVLEWFRANGVPLEAMDAEQRDHVEHLLAWLKCELNVVYQALRTAGRTLRSTAPGAPGAEDSFGGAVGVLGIAPDHLRYVLDGRWAAADGNGDSAGESDHSHDRRMVRARELLDRGGDFGIPGDLDAGLRGAATILKDSLVTAFESASKRCADLLDPGLSVDPDGPCVALLADGVPTAEVQRAVRTYLWDFYRDFEHYDQIRFPIFYEAEVGESDVVEVIRISPEDATSLIDERGGAGRRKLAGTALHNFGAFLDRVWRQNDVMWGRLDGAERLVCSLLPEPRDEAVRRRLIAEAHAAILREEMPPAARQELGALMSQALVRASAGEPSRRAIDSVIGRLTAESPVQKRLESVLRASLTDAELLRYMSTGYEVDRRLDPRSVLETVSRSTEVSGRIFQDIADRQGLQGRHLGWIARLGQAFWGLVAVAVPNSLLNLLVMHWFALLVVFQGVIIVGAFLLNEPVTLRFGWAALGITVGLAVTVLVLRDTMRGRGRWLRLAVGAFATALLLLAAVGADRVFGLHLYERVIGRTPPAAPAAERTTAERTP
jgi:patatin-related protein